MYEKLHELYGKHGVYFNMAVTYLLDVGYTNISKVNEEVIYQEALKKEQINKVSLIAFTQNDIGNAFWKQIGWTKREDLNYYDFTLNEKNITAFNQ